MQTLVNLRRLTGSAALVATAAGGLGALAATACDPIVPTATLRNGTVAVTGTAGDDHIDITVDANRLVVDFGADGTVDAEFPRSDVERLQVAAGGGNDGVGITGAGLVPITVNGDAGDDGIGVTGQIGGTGVGDAPTTISGDDGNDNIFVATPGPVTVLGGAGDDRVDGGGAGVGQERISLGDGNDRFVSDLNAFIGTRSDVVDGGAGQDAMEMDGSFADETLVLSADAGHLIVDHNVRDRIDAVGVEDVSYQGFGGLDIGDGIAVNDLSGTGVTHFTPDFSAGHDDIAPNHAADILTVRGTDKVDHITVSGSGADTTIAGLTPTVTPINLEPQDLVRIETLDGNDVVDSSGLQAGVVQLLVL